MKQKRSYILNNYRVVFFVLCIGFTTIHISVYSQQNGESDSTQVRDVVPKKDTTMGYSLVGAAKIYKTTKNRKVKKSFSETIKKAKKRIMGMLWTD